VNSELRRVLKEVAVGQHSSGRNE